MTEISKKKYRLSTSPSPFVKSQNLPFNAALNTNSSFLRRGFYAPCERRMYATVCPQPPPTDPRGVSSVVELVRSVRPRHKPFAGVSASPSRCAADPVRTVASPSSHLAALSRVRTHCLIVRLPDAGCAPLADEWMAVERAR